MFAGHGGFVMHRLVTSFCLGFALLLTSHVGFAQLHHIEAKNCELYVEKIQLMPGSYSSIIANIYLRVSLPHLDGAIREVGFRLRTYTSPVDLIEDRLGWHNMVATQVDPFTDDQWKVSVLLDAGFLALRHVGAFYVRTDTNTVYWLHPMNASDENFSIDTNTFAFDNELMWGEIWINDFDRYLGFNPERCK